MSALARVLIERFRCPESYVKLRLRDHLSADKGFFRFGDSLCYGRSSVGGRKSQIERLLYDVAADVILSGSEVHLPFDPAEVVENFRLERYPGIQDSWIRRRLREVYYLVRPVMPIQGRKLIQTIQLKGWTDLRFPNWPVDRTVETICEQLLLLALQVSGTDRIPFIWFWPRGHSGCIAMTHDVETESGRDFCHQLMDIDNSFGMKSAFTIVPERRYGVSPEFLAEIRNRGFEIGVQDLNHDGRLFDDKDEFKKRAERINKYARVWGCKGFRAAVLYRNTEWFDALDFGFDMSIPNTARLDPQRGGCCTVMPYFIGKILELPVTTTQDYMLFHLLGERTIKLWKEQIELILERNGLISFIIHPDYLLDEALVSMYKELLIHLRELQAAKAVWMAFPSEIDCWWRQRSRMQLVRRGGSEWQIEGEGAERATVAYAMNAGGKLIYEMEAGAAPAAQLADVSLQKFQSVTRPL